MTQQLPEEIFQKGLPIMQITERLDARESCVLDHNCPAVFATTSIDIAIIGRLADRELRDSLAGHANVGPGEELVTIPRIILASAFGCRCRRR